MNATAKVCESHGKSDNTCVLPQSSQKSTGKHITFESQDTIPCLDDKITCTIYKIYDGATDLITQVPNEELQYASTVLVQFSTSANQIDVLHYRGWTHTAFNNTEQLSVNLLQILKIMMVMMVGAK